MTAYSVSGGSLSGARPKAASAAWTPLRRSAAALAATPVEVSVIAAMLLSFSSGAGLVRVGAAQRIPARVKADGFPCLGGYRAELPDLLDGGTSKRTLTSQEKTPSRVRASPGTGQGPAPQRPRPVTDQRLDLPSRGLRVEVGGRRTLDHDLALGDQPGAAHGPDVDQVAGADHPGSCRSG